MNLLSLFSGIGAFEKALKNEGIDYNLVNYCEIDKYASKSYSAIHNVSETLNLTDVTKIDTTNLSNVDLITYGFPCQDISQAGHQRGFTDDNGERTRSGLFFEALRIIKDLKPKYAIAENVKALTSKKFKAEFDTVLSSLNDAGYNNYYKVLNAKDFGVPQNRERVFIVSIRKDVDDGSFIFPTPQPLNIRLKDVLEENVDEKFYLSNEQIKRIHTTTYLSGQRRIQDKEWCDTLCARDWKDPKCVRVGGIWDTETSKHQAGSIYDPNGISSTLDTMQGGSRTPYIITHNIKQQLDKPTVCEERKDEGLRFFKDNVCGALRTKDSCGDKRVIEPKIIQVGNIVHTGNFSNPQRGRVYSVNGISPTLNNCEGCGRDPKIIEPTAAAMRGRQNGQQLEISDREYSNALTTVQKDSLVNCNFRIRKLTPKECWRLMGFTDEDFEKAKSVGISNSQLYKQAGNSIVVTVLQWIFKNLFKDKDIEK